MKPLLTDQQHRNLSFCGMTMIAMGLPLSKILMSVGFFVLAGNWILEGRHLERIKQFITNPLSLAVSSVFLIHCIGLLWTEDFGWGTKDIRVKLPILILPLILFTSKLPNKRRIEDVIKTFVLACVLATLFGVVQYFGADGDVVGGRQLSVFISHIRFGLMVVLAIFILLYLLRSKRYNWSFIEKLVALIVLCWFLVFLVVLGSFTAYLAMGFLASFTLIRLLVVRGSRVIKLSILSLTTLFITMGYLFTTNFIKEYFFEVPTNWSGLPRKTVNGNFYAYSPNIGYRENGHRIWYFVCMEELEKEWTKRSSYSLDGLDRNGQKLKYTVLRYITSKGLPKDSLGVHQLSEADIQNIEAGYTNYLAVNRLFVVNRLHQILWAYEDYLRTENTNNSSLLQRLVYLKVGLEIVKRNVAFGVGTGDLVMSYEQEYLTNNFGLKKSYQGISHNQLITIMITLGVTGFVVFLIGLAYPVWLYKRDFLYVCFMLLMLASFLTDNTFDRQAGVTLFAFFNSILIIRNEFEKIG